MSNAQIHMNYCEALNPERLVHWQTIMKEMPLAMSGEVSELPDQIKTEYLLSGLNNSYIHDRQNLYESIAGLYQHHV